MNFGESWWNYIDGETSDSSTRTLWQSYHINLVAKQEQLAKDIMIFFFTKYFLHILKGFNMP
jgi:hypothetical protein